MPGGMGDDSKPAARRSVWASANVALASHALLLWALPSASLEKAPGNSTIVLEIEAAAARTLTPPTDPPPSAAASRAAAAQPARSPAPSRAPHAQKLRAPRPASGTHEQSHPLDRAAFEPTPPPTRDAAALAALHSATAVERPVAADGGDGARLGLRETQAQASNQPLARASVDLSRRPRLLAAGATCAGYFPATSPEKVGQVQLDIEVDAQGQPHACQTLLELPKRQGFEGAAKACASRLRFAPALDSHGHPVRAYARIALRFERS